MSCSRSLSLLLLLPLAACPRGPVGPGPARGEQRNVLITILSTNDLHGQLEPLPRLTEEQPPRVIHVGGAEALAATIGELRGTNPDGVVLLDAGDFMQGSLLSNGFEGAPLRGLFAHLKYDAAAIGNHEFDFGPVGAPDPLPLRGDLLGALKAWARAAPMPLLSANLSDARGHAVRWPGLRPSVIVERRGVRVGVIGLTTPKTAVTTMPVFVRELRFDPLLPVARREARALRAAGAAVVVLLAHVDGSCRSADPGSCRGELFDLVRQLEPGLVDVVVAGHAHACIRHRVNGVHVLEACSQSEAVGVLELLVDPRARRVVRVVSGPRFRQVCAEVFADSGGCAVDSAGAIGPSPLLARPGPLVNGTRALLAPYRAKIRGRIERVLGHAARALRNRRDGRSEVGALFVRALSASIPGADFALVNAGAIRADLPAGPITFGRLFEAFPFDNRLATVKLTGLQLREVIARILGRAAGIAVISGLRLQLRCADGRPALAALSRADGRALEPERSYTLVLNDFLLSGGDGLGPVLDPIPAEYKRVFTDRLVRDEIASYLQRQRRPVNSDADPLVDPADPPVRFEHGPCRRERTRPTCR
jgi:5'-nucleotidase